jgi:hypothetical protein
MRSRRSAGFICKVCVEFIDQRYGIIFTREPGTHCRRKWTVTEKNSVSLNRMKKSILFFFLILTISCAVTAQVKVYKGTSSYTSDVICTVEDGNVYKKTSSYTSDILCHVAKNRVYKGNSNYTGDVIYTVADGKVYKGTSSYTSDIEFTIKDGKVFKGTSSYTSDILATIEDGRVYSGTSSYTSDIQFTIHGNLTIEEFVAVWYAVKYCY